MNQRLETFCDAVFAIAITLLILEIKVPPIDSMHSTHDVWVAVGKLWPSFFALTFSFLIIFISWIGHHNMLKEIEGSSPQFQFANGFFLLTVVIIPFPTAFMAEYLNTPYAQPAIVVYSLNAILHNAGWNVLYYSVLNPKSLLKPSVNLAEAKKRMNGVQFGFVIYILLAVMAWWLPYISLTINYLTWVYWAYLSLSFKVSYRR